MSQNEFGDATPIFRVKDMTAGIDYYVKVLGFGCIGKGRVCCVVSRDRCGIRHLPTYYPGAYEMQVEDLDGNVLRFGSDPKAASLLESGWVWTAGLGRSSPRVRRRQ